MDGAAIFQTCKPTLFCDAYPFSINDRKIQKLLCVFHLNILPVLFNLKMYSVEIKMSTFEIRKKENIWGMTAFFMY